MILLHYPMSPCRTQKLKTSQNMENVRYNIKPHHTPLKIVKQHYILTHYKLYHTSIFNKKLILPLLQNNKPDKH